MGNKYIAAEDDFIGDGESSKTIFYMVRMSLYHLIYLRGLYPDNYFTATKMALAQGMEVRMLNDRLRKEQNDNFVEAVEEGVSDAFNKKYMGKLQFVIATTEQPYSIMEEYTYKFEYDLQDLGLSMELCSLGNALMKDGKVSRPTIKFQVTKLLRNLVVLCNTLLPVPEERQLDLWITLNEKAPCWYCPKHFQEAEKEYQFPRTPTTMDVGTVITGYHAASMSLATLLTDKTPKPSPKPSPRGTLDFK